MKSQSKKYEIKGNSQFLQKFSNFLANWEKIGSTAEACIKKPNFPFTSWIGKNWEVNQKQHSKILKCLCELETTWNYSLIATLKDPNFESMNKLGRYMT